MKTLGIIFVFYYSFVSCTKQVSQSKSVDQQSSTGQGGTCQATVDVKVEEFK